MAANSYATKECLYCGRVNNADVTQCAGCGAGSFGPIQYSAPPRTASDYVPQIPLGPVEQVSPPVRIIYFLFFGYLVGLLWLLATVVVMLTIIGYPLGQALFRALPTVLLLQREREPLGYTIGQGWAGTVAMYQKAPWWAKILAPVSFVVYIGVIISYLTS